MTRFHRYSVVLLASLAAAAYAAPKDVEITAQRPSRVAADVVQATPHFDVHYMMSTGRKLQVVAAGQAMRVRYGHRLASFTYQGDGNFRTHDGAIEMSFELDRDGNPGLVTLTGPASWLGVPTMTAAANERVTLVARVSQDRR